MADTQTVPRIVFGQLELASDGKLLLTSGEMLAYRSLFAKVESDNALDISFVESGGPLQEAWEKGAFQTHIEILHLQLDTLAQQIEETAQDETWVSELSDQLSGIKELQLLVLAGSPKADWVRNLLLKQIPIALTTGEGELGETFGIAFYTRLLKGNSIRQAFDETKRNTRIAIQKAELKYDSEKQELTWDAIRYGKNLRWERGLWTRAQHRGALNWRLQNPLKIAAKERISPLSVPKPQPKPVPEESVTKPFSITPTEEKEAPKATPEVIPPITDKAEPSPDQKAPTSLPETKTTPSEPVPNLGIDDQTASPKTAESPTPIVETTDTPSESTDDWESAEQIAPATVAEASTSVLETEAADQATPSQPAASTPAAIETEETTSELGTDPNPVEQTASPKPVEATPTTSEPEEADTVVVSDSSQSDEEQSLQAQNIPSTPSDTPGEKEEELEAQTGRGPDTSSVDLSTVEEEFSEEEPTHPTSELSQETGETEDSLTSASPEIAEEEQESAKEEDRLEPDTVQTESEEEEALPAESKSPSEAVSASDPPAVSVEADNQVVKVEVEFEKEDPQEPIVEEPSQEIDPAPLPSVKTKPEDPISVSKTTEVKPKEIRTKNETEDAIAQFQASLAKAREKLAALKESEEGNSTDEKDPSSTPVALSSSSTSQESSSDTTESPSLDGQTDSEEADQSEKSIGVAPADQGGASPTSDLKQEEGKAVADKEQVSAKLPSEVSTDQTSETVLTPSTQAVQVSVPDADKEASGSGTQLKTEVDPDTATEVVSEATLKDMPTTVAEDQPAVIVPTTTDEAAESQVTSETAEDAPVVTEPVRLVEEEIDKSKNQSEEAGNSTSGEVGLPSLDTTDTTVNPKAEESTADIANQLETHEDDSDSKVEEALTGTSATTGPLTSSEEKESVAEENTGTAADKKDEVERPTLPDSREEDPIQAKEPTRKQPGISTPPTVKTKPTTPPSAEQSQTPSPIIPTPKPPLPEKGKFEPTQPENNPTPVELFQPVPSSKDQKPATVSSTDLSGGLSSQETSTYPKIEPARRVRPRKPKLNEEETPTPDAKPTRNSRINKPKPATNTPPPPPTKSNNRWGWWAGGTGVLVSLAAAAWFFLFNTGDPEATCPFPTEDPAYKVLVLPFHQDIDCSKNDPQFSERLITYLNQMSRREGIRLSILQDNDPCLNTADLSSFIEYCHADMVVGGIWAATSSQASQLTLYIQSSDHFNEALFINRAQLAASFEKPNLDALLDGMIQRTAGLIRWAAGVKATERRAYSQAADIMGRIAAMTPTQRKMVNSLWAANMKDAGRYDEALDSLRLWLGQYPGEISYHREYAEILQKMGWTDRAIEAYKQGRAATNDALPLVLGQANLMIETGEYREAEALLEQATEANGELGVIQYVAGRLAEQRGALRRAESYYTQSIELNDRYLAAYIARANIRVIQDNQPAARNDIQQVLAIDPNNLDAQLFNARQLVLEENGEPALEAYNLAINTRASAQAYYERGNLSQQLGLIKEALDDYALAIKLSPAMADAYFSRGKIFQATQQWGDALANLEILEKLRPGYAEVHVLKGNLLSEQENYEGAFEAFDQAIELDEEYAAAYYGRALVSLATDEPAKALVDVNKALKLAPESADPLLSRARIYVEQDKINLARKDFDRAIRLAPENAEAYFFRAELEEKEGDLAAAKADYQQAIAIGSGHFRSYIALGELAARALMYDEALRWYDEAVQFAPTSPEGFSQRAKLKVTLRKYREAEADLAKADDLIPQPDISFLTLRTEVFQILGRNNEALIEINKAIREAPDDMNLYCIRGNLYQQMNRENKALEDFTKAVELAPNAAKPYYYRAELYRQMKAWDDAKSELNTAMKNDRSFAPAFNLAGEIALQLGEIDQAEELFQGAAKADPTFAMTYVNLGQVARKQRAYDEAVRYYNQAITYDPRNEEAFYQRGFIRSARGDGEGAIQDLSKALDINPDLSLAYGLLAKIYARRGEDEAVYSYAQQALEHRYPLIELEQDPAFTHYQGDPRFQEVIEKYQ